MLISELDLDNNKKALYYQARAEKYCNKDTNDLDCAFIWGHTKEGYLYWKQLHEAILVDNDVPKHYKNATNKDVIDFCHDNNINFCRGSAIKYIVRAGKKDDEIEDLKKAIDFLQREIKNLKK
jgi:hypothetical protein